MGIRFDTSDIRLLVGANKYTDEEIEQLIIYGNPVLWSEQYLRNPDHPSESLYLRSYQRNMLLSSAKNKIIRCGRRIGKTVCLCTEALWNAVTESDTRVVIIAPMKENIAEITRVLNGMTQDSPLIMKSIVSKSKDPFSILFNNNSSIVALAGNKYPEKIRGKGCNNLYLDEADYLNEEALAAVLALLMTKTQCNICLNEMGTDKCHHIANHIYNDIVCDPIPISTMWCSSTPTGAREWFYEKNQIAKEYIEKHGDKNPLYALFHYPSSASPLWGPQMENEMKMQITDPMRWIHEVLAEFGDSAHAVYRGELIDKALERGKVPIQLGNGHIISKPYSYNDFRLDQYV